MKTFAVIGKNFGDEGKGLVSASLCLHYGEKLIIKHNGGAQAGHTVEISGADKKDGEIEKSTRFIHHQIGSGAELGADTLFSETYCPDLYQLSNEMEDFHKLYGFLPAIYSEENTPITIIDDVLINMALESHRGDNRHGSCGMGINECRERMNAGFVLTVSDIKNNSVEWVCDRLKSIREQHTQQRVETLGLEITAEFTDENIIENYAEEIKRNAEYVNIAKVDRNWLEQYDIIVFETGQGLLLDEFYLKYAPYLTTSRTGACNPARFLDKRGLKLDEIIYVSRSYVTRHGNGPLPYECTREDLRGVQHDRTNEPNEWQGTIRYAYHPDYENFFEAIDSDILDCTSIYDAVISLAITHLSETEGKMYFYDREVSFEEFKQDFICRDISGTNMEINNIYGLEERYIERLL